MLSAPQYSISSQSNANVAKISWLYFNITELKLKGRGGEKCLHRSFQCLWLSDSESFIDHICEESAVFLCFLPHFLRGLKEIADLPDSMAFLLLSWNMKNSVQLSQPTQKAFHELVRNRTIHLNIVPDNSITLNVMLWVVARYQKISWNDDWCEENLGQELYCKNKECNLNYFSLSTRFSPNFSLQLSPARHCIV